jgi:predicted RNase H-like HicB family nuclease
MVYNGAALKSQSQRLIRHMSRLSTLRAMNLTSIIERDGEWFIGRCPEVPSANGQGRNEQECLENLWEAVKLIMEDRRSESF